MADISVQRIKYGWRVDLGELTLDAENPRFNRGAVHTVFTACNGAAIYYRDTANLTSSRGRGTIIKKLAAKGVSLTEEPLLALDQACRLRASPAPEKNNVATPPDFSDKVDNIDNIIDLQRQMSVFLLLEDPDVVPLTLAAYAVHSRSDEIVWLILVAPPSGSKTELITALGHVPKVYFLSKLTARTLASGLEAKGGDPSLLARLSDEVLLLKDFTTVLGLRYDERQEILSQLREIYDGQYDNVWGNGKELHWRGRLGLIAGVTPVIDSYHAVLSVLGERFVMLRVLQGNRTKTAKKALANAGRSSNMRRDMASAITGFLSTLPPDLPTVPLKMQEDLAALADFVTRCRSGVVRDGYRRELEYAPEPEMPARFAKQLFTLLQGVALVCGRAEASQEDYERIVRVARDCLPAARWKVLSALASASMDLSTTLIAQHTQSPTATVRRALEACRPWRWSMSTKAVRARQIFGV